VVTITKCGIAGQISKRIHHNDLVVLAKQCHLEKGRELKSKFSVDRLLGEPTWYRMIVNISSPMEMS